jgi:hypothetical protein
MDMQSFGARVACLGILLLLAAPALAAENRKEKKEAANESYALLMGSCFNEKGLSLPGVAVEVKRKEAANPKLAKQRWTAISSLRGEFAVRLPAGENTFVVSAGKEGYQPQQKEVTFVQDERLDVLFNFEPVSSSR